LETPENEPIVAPLVEPPNLPAAPRTVAPVWHTVVLIMGLLALSVAGRASLSMPHAVPNRMVTYITTAIFELAMLGWVALGLRLRKVPMRTLFGVAPGDMRSIARDFSIALVFWVGSLMVLGSLGILWTSVEAAVTHRQAATGSGHVFAPTPSQKETLKTLEELAPANGEQIAGWVLLCLLVGLVEETVFRGYLQSQFTAWAHGGAAVGVVFSALLFGAAHGYQGVRNMVLLSVFGALLSLLALFRRGLRSCIFAHSWHDIIAGVALGALRSHHLL
jgi:CAAX protease family protein